MTIEYHIDPDEGYVLERGYGKATVDDFADLVRRLAADPAFRPGMPKLCDFRQLEFDLPVDEIEQIYSLMQELAEEFGDSRIAIVPAGDLEFGLARMFGMISSQARFETQVFRDMERARAWLGLQSEIPDRA